MALNSYSSASMRTQILSASFSRRRLIGILDEGDKSEPVVACFNHDSRGVKGVHYRISCVDAEGNEVNKTSYGSINRDKSIMDSGKSTATTDGSGPDEGGVDAKVTVFSVTFDDDSKWSPSN